MKQKMSNREMDVMNILWQAEEPLTASAITKSREELSINTVQVVLKNLKKKSYVNIADIVYSGTVLSRAYQAAISKVTYISTQVLEDKRLSKDVLAALIANETDLKLIAELEEILRERKNQLSKH